MVALIIIGVVLFVLIAYVITIYNGLIQLKNNINKSWANIDVLLKQRHDEIPKLVKTCEGYMKYEKKTLTEVIALRNTAAAAHSVGEKASAESALSLGLGKLFALAENYPDLKSQQNFLHLQKTCIGY